MRLIYAATAVALAFAPSTAAASAAPVPVIVTLDEASGAHTPTTTHSDYTDTRMIVHLTTNSSALHKDTFNTDARAYITSLVKGHRLPETTMSGHDLAARTVVEVIDPSLHKVGFYHHHGMTFPVSDEDITNSALPQAKQGHWPQAFAAMDAKAFAKKTSPSPNNTAPPTPASAADQIGIGLLVIGLPVGGLALYWLYNHRQIVRAERRRDEAKRAEDQRRKDNQAEANAMPRPNRADLLAHQEKIVGQIDPSLSDDLRERLRTASTPKIIRDYLDHGATGWSLSKMRDLQTASSDFLGSRPSAALSLYRNDAKVSQGADDVIHRLEVLNEAPEGARRLAARINEMCRKSETRVRDLHAEYLDTTRQTMLPDEYVTRFNQIYSTTRNDVAQAVQEFAGTPTGQAILQQRRSSVTSAPSRSYLRQNSSLTTQRSANAMLDAVMFGMFLSEMPSSHHSSSSSSSSDSSFSSSSFDSSSFSSGGFDGGSSSW